MKRVLVLTIVLFAGVGWAFEPSQPNPQQVDGQDTSDSCGMGWDIMDSPTLFGTSVRSTTNMILPPAFSMTSGTSGCAQHGFAKNEMEGVKFAVVNQDILTAELAEGQGEYVYGLAAAMGCDSAHYGEFGQMAQDAYGEIVTSEGTSAIDMYKNVKKQVQNNPALVTACNIG